MAVIGTGSEFTRDRRRRAEGIRRSCWMRCGKSRAAKLRFSAPFRGIDGSSPRQARSRTTFARAQSLGTDQAIISALRLYRFFQPSMAPSRRPRQKQSRDLSVARQKYTDSTYRHSQGMCVESAREREVQGPTCSRFVPQHHCQIGGDEPPHRLPRPAPQING